MQAMLFAITFTALILSSHSVLAQGVGAPRDGIGTPTQGIGSPEIGIGAPEHNFYRSFEPLDFSHTKNQRTDIKQRFISMGYNLKINTDDIPILQKMLMLGKVQRNDIATQQAMGVVLGDMLAERLNMEWIIVHDQYGRSRALRYRKTDIVVFPVTLISRRYKTGLNVDIQALYDKTVASVEKQITTHQQRRRYY